MEKYDVRPGDCVEVLAALPAGAVACVIADPPYGVTKLAWDKPLDWPAVWAQLHRVTPPAADWPPSRSWPPRLWHPEPEVRPSRVQTP